MPVKRFEDAEPCEAPNHICTLPVMIPYPDSAT